MADFDAFDAVYRGTTRLDHAFMGTRLVPLPYLKRGNFQSHVKAPYQAYTGMWGHYLPQNNQLQAVSNVKVFPIVFPARTTFSWNVTPDSDWSGVNGYLSICYGNYDDSAVSITPRQVYTITDLTPSVNWSWGGGDGSGLLCECWVSTTSHASGSITDKVAEVSFHPRVSSSGRGYIAGLGAVGTGSYTDSLGVTWSVVADTTVTPTFYIAYRPGFAEYQGAFAFKDLFAFLISAGRLTGNEWFNGVAFGPEPHTGTGSATIESFTTSYTGAARVPWTITNLSASPQSSSTIRLDWSAAPGFTSHQYRVNGGAWTTTTASNTHLVTGLAASTSYTFEVRGLNSTGGGVASNVVSASTVAPATSDVITNGAFNDGSAWTGYGYSGKSISGGKANFTASPAYDDFNQAITVTANKYYELTWTISGRTAGNVFPQLTGGTTRSGTVRAANGTFTERLRANTGNNRFYFMMETGGTLSVDNISLIGPFETATVGGA